MKIQDKIINIINKAYLNLLNNLDDASYSEKSEMILEIPNDSKFGDYSTNLAMRSAKIFKKSPIQIGEDIKTELEKLDKAKELFADIQVVKPGFINFYLKPEAVVEYLAEIIEKKDDYGKSDIGGGKKVNIEFVSANPTGPLHVGHGRGAAIGDILANIYSYAGFDVTREYYLNDCGRQINILGKTVSLWIDAIQNDKEPEFLKDEDYYKGSYMKDVAESVIKKVKENGMDFLSSQRMTEEQEKQLGYFAGEIILEGIKQDLKDFRVKDFDVWTSEKDFHDNNKIKASLDQLESKGYIENKDEAKWFKSSEFGDEKDRVVERSNGVLTYFAADIAYHNDKLNRGFDKLIDIWGADHHGYIPRVKAVIQALGNNPDKLDVILCQLVKLLRGGEPAQMSTRSGEFVSLKEVVDEVGADAARFFFIMRKQDAQLDFDLEVAKKQSIDNPVYYIQYAYARICSILKRLKSEDGDKCKPENRGNPLTEKRGILEEYNELLKILLETGKGVSPLAVTSKLSAKEELLLIKIMINFQDIIEGSASCNEPHRIAGYLQNLAAAFHSFYAKHKVMTDDNDLTLARLMLVNAVKIVIKNGLTVLGISVREEM